MRKTIWRRGTTRTASIEVKNVLNNDPANADARSMLATILLGLDDVLGAEKELQRAAEYGADESTLTHLRYAIWEAKGEHLEILASLSRDDIPLSEAEQSKFRGNALIATGSGDAAKATFEKWLATEPGSVDAMIGLARATAVAGQLDEAIEALTSIVSQHPDQVDAWLALGNFQFASGNYQSAKEAYATSIEHKSAATEYPSLSVYSVETCGCPASASRG